jgi:integrase/recombinase XerC
VSGATLAVVCQRARSELASLGDLGTALVSTLGVVERAGRSRGLDALDDPGFAIDVLTSQPGIDPALVGRVLDYLRSREGHTGGRAAPAVTLADAIAGYEAGPLALMAPGTGSTYRTWTRRLANALGDDQPRDLTAGDLKDLIARHVLASRRTDERRRSGRSAEENAIGAFRSLWGYMVEKGWVDDNVAARLTKPGRAEPNRRPIQPEEAQMLRHLARATGRDPLLDEVTLTLPERLGLRRIEICRLRLCDLDLDRKELEIFGKGDKPRTMPVPPGLADLLAGYVEDRRPQHLSTGEWLASEATLLRVRPTAAFPEGRATGRRRIEDMFKRLHRTAPQVFARGDVSLHSYRHAIGTFVDARYGRAVTRAVLGHTSRRSATDFYVHVSMDQKSEAVTAYETHVTAVAGQEEDPAA